MADAANGKIIIAGLDVWAPPVRKVILDAMPPEFEIRFADTFDRPEQLKLAEEAHVLVSGRASIDAEMIAHAKNLRFIQKWGAGTDNIALDEARKRGIAVAIPSGLNSNPVAEHAVLLMLAVLRRLSLVDSSLRKGTWLQAEMRSVCMQLTGRTVGIVGFGNIGRTVALLLRGFETRTFYYSRNRIDRSMERAFKVSYRPLDELLAQSDIVSLHAPLTPETKHMINAEALAKMQRHATLINTARGALVDEKALYEALRDKKIFGAGLDVFDVEPATADNPLFTLDNVVVTPHYAGSVFDNVPNVARHVMGNIARFVNGEDLPAADVIIPRQK